MYYVWSISGKYPESCWLEYDWDNNPDYLQFLGNEKIVEPTESIIFNVGKKVNLKTFLKFDYIMSDATSLISEKLASLILKYAPTDLQLIKASVYQGKDLIGLYYIPVYLHIVDCIDKKLSIYDKD